MSGTTSTKSNETSSDSESFSLIRSILEVKDPSLIIVLVIPILLSFHSELGILETNAQNIAAVVFQVSGTMVALALPAAQLSYGLVSDLEKEMTFVLNLQENEKKKREVISNLTVNLKNELKPAWRAILYVFLGFVLSAIAIILPADKTTWFNFSFDIFCAFASLLFVIVGSYWFYPTAKYAFQLKILNLILDEFLKNLDSKPLNGANHVKNNTAASFGSGEPTPKLPIVTPVEKPATDVAEQTETSPSENTQ